MHDEDDADNLDEHRQDVVDLSTMSHIQKDTKDINW